MCLVLSLVAGRVAPASVDERTHGVPFSACPPCTTPFVPVALGLSFVGSDNVTLTGVVSGVAGWPGAPAGSLRIVCGSAVLNGTHPVVLESAGPRPTTSRIFNENHPSRSGGFLADNVVWMSPSAQSALSGEGLLFKSAGRYDEHNPPLSDDGPAPGPGKCGGFELNIYWNGMQYVLQRFNAEEQRIDIEVRKSAIYRFVFFLKILSKSRGTLSFGVSSANSSNCASLELKKEMIDISLVVGHQVLASGRYEHVLFFFFAPCLKCLINQPGDGWWSPGLACRLTSRNCGKFAAGRISGTWRAPELQSGAAGTAAKLLSSVLSHL